MRSSNRLLRNLISWHQLSSRWSQRCCGAALVPATFIHSGRTRSLPCSLHPDPQFNTSNPPHNPEYSTSPRVTFKTIQVALTATRSNTLPTLHNVANGPSQYNPHRCQQLRTRIDPPIRQTVPTSLSTSPTEPADLT